MTTTPTHYLLSPEVAERLRTTQVNVTRMARRGELRGAMVAGQWLFDEAHIDEYVQSRMNHPVTTRKRRARRMRGAA